MNENKRIMEAAEAMFNALHIQLHKLPSPAVEEFQMLKARLYSTADTCLWDAYAQGRKDEADENTQAYVRGWEDACFKNTVDAGIPSPKESRLEEEVKTLNTILDNVHAQNEDWDNGRQAAIASLIQEIELLKQEHKHEIAVLLKALNNYKDRMQYITKMIDSIKRNPIE